MFRHPLDEHHHLRLFEESDAPELSAVIAANRGYLSRWLPWPPAQTEAATVEFIRRSRQQFGANQGFQAGIISHDAIVGVVGFHALDWQNRSTTIGYWLAEDAQGQGLITRGCHALLDHAFSVWKMNRVELRAAVDNIRSRRVAERLGMTFEGCKRQAERLSDRYVDHAVYAVLAAEWPGAASAAFAGMEPG